MRAILRTVAATLLVAATVVLLPSAPATAAGCGGTSGVTVVVDPNQLGGSISAGCDGNGGVAANNFADAGYGLEYATGTGMAGFVCKVSGRPADGDCTQTTSYWSLWWSDGTSGKWVYSSRGVSSLRVPDGGYVAFAWHQGGGQATPPGVQPTPRVATATPTPTPKPSASATRKPGQKQTKKPSATKSTAQEPAAPATSATPSDTASPTANPTATPSDKAKKREKESEAAEPGPSDVTPTDPGTTDLPTIDEIADASAVTEPDVDDDGGFPTWVGIGLAVLVLGAAGAVPLLRRRG